MKRFAELYEALDSTNKTSAKVAHLVAYFKEAPENDILWTLYFFGGRRPKRVISGTLARQWLSELTALPLWLIEESYGVVGDLAETVAQLLPESESTSSHSLTQWVQVIDSLKALDEDGRREAILKAWSSLSRNESFVFTKMITGAWRIGVSEQLVLRALAEHTGTESNILVHRLMGKWDPHTTDYNTLIGAQEGEGDLSRPYPFCLAHPITEPVENLGDTSEWLAEWKWDGIRSQIIVRGGELFVWSRGEELITDRFPELAGFVTDLPDGTVIDGELVCYQEGSVMPFQILQKRIGRKTLTTKILAEAPVVVIAYDLLEYEGRDLRGKPLSFRRTLLEQVVKAAARNVLLLSEAHNVGGWEALKKLREQSREVGSEGLMLKRLSSEYAVGRRRGDWWKWKIEPLSVDAVLVYAQRGSGRRADLFTDYTFAVWDKETGKLVPFAKAYSGLTDKEIAQVDAFIKANTLEKFGPVRTVKAQLVFEIGFEGIMESSRHKSGIAVRFPRMLRWRTDKAPEDADTLDTLKALLTFHQSHSSNSTTPAASNASHES